MLWITLRFSTVLKTNGVVVSFTYAGYYIGFLPRGKPHAMLMSECEFMSMAYGSLRLDKHAWIYSL